MLARLSNFAKGKPWPSPVSSRRPTNGTTLRVPLLGDLPVVGTMFSSNRIETVETELIVLVTPELVAPMELHEVPERPAIG